MLNDFIVGNGKIIQSSPLTYAITVLDKDGSPELTTTLMHPHFDEVVLNTLYDLRLKGKVAVDAAPESTFKSVAESYISQLSEI